MNVLIKYEYRENSIDDPVTEDFVMLENLNSLDDLDEAFKAHAHKVFHKDSLKKWPSPFVKLVWYLPEGSSIQETPSMSRARRIRDINN